LIAGWARESLLLRNLKAGLTHGVFARASDHTGMTVPFTTVALSKGILWAMFPFVTATTIQWYFGTLPIQSLLNTMFTKMPGYITGVSVTGICTTATHGGSTG